MMARKQKRSKEDSRFNGLNGTEIKYLKRSIEYGHLDDGHKKSKHKRSK